MKRIIDILEASLDLLLLSPVLAIVAYRIDRDMGAPVLFSQTRPGRRGEPFQMIKFRTMLSAIDKGGRPLHDAERLIKLGEFLRVSSLNELPELWILLQGQMRLVLAPSAVCKYVKKGF